MDPNTLFSKCITLLYRESQVDGAIENSAALVKTTIEKVKLSEGTIGLPSKRDTTIALRNFVLDMCRRTQDHKYEHTDILQQIRLITNGDENLYKAIAQGIDHEFQQPVLKRMITNLRKTIGDQFKENKQADIISRAYRDLTFGRHNIPDSTAYLRNVITELEVTLTKTAAGDPGIVKSMIFEDDDSMRDIFDTVKNSNTEGLAFTMPWRELNTALQGGPRPGDCVVMAALQHNYKTGASLSLFGFIPILNKPKNKDPGKKPLAYRISCEDPIRNNAQFLYQLLKYDETREPVDVKNITTEEMWKYVQARMKVNGYHILIDEVNPLNWTYQSIINRIIQLESEGYVVEVLEIDYLSKIPTTGCAQGSLGDDVMDQLSRVRAYCLAHGILLITPHQLSTEAKRKLESVPQEQFLHAIKGGGFFEKTKGLDRIYDIGLLIHKLETQSGDYLHMVIDKHRFPSVVDSSLKSWFLSFPSCKMPIPSNVNDEDYKILRKVPRAKATADDAFFV